MSLVSVNRGETEDILEMVWPFFGSWWPSWSECSMTLSSRFFQLSDSPALFITPQDQQLLNDSRSVMHPRWISLQSTTMCFANAIYKEWIQERERVQWREFRAFQVPSHTGIFKALRCYLRRDCRSHFTFNGKLLVVNNRENTKRERDNSNRACGATYLPHHRTAKMSVLVRFSCKDYVMIQVHALNRERWCYCVYWDSLKCIPFGCENLILTEGSCTALYGEVFLLSSLTLGSLLWMVCTEQWTHFTHNIICVQKALWPFKLHFLLLFLNS